MNYFLFNFCYFIIFLFHVSCADGVVPINELKSASECKSDIERLCDSSEVTTDFNILKCLQKSDKIITSVSTECQHFVWNYKNKLTTLEYFEKYTGKSCQAEFRKFKNCKQQTDENSIICLLKHKNDIDSTTCRLNVDEFATIVFSDILIIHNFLRGCSKSVNELKCGRLQSNASLTFSPQNLALRIATQTHTIDCLIDKLPEVEEVCRKQLLRLNELQADDYRLNPGIFHNCQDEREQFCGSVPAGDSRVYNCLEKHKFSQGMSADCRNSLVKKQSAESQDYKIRILLDERCAEDIRNHHCIAKSEEDNIIKMDKIILCLLEGDKLNKINPACKREVLDYRMQLVNDAENIDPDLKINCENEIQYHCSQYKKVKDDLLHCLMRKSIGAGVLNFSSICSDTVQKFLKVVNPTEDIGQLDPIIGRACATEIRDRCHLSNSNEIYGCLLELIQTDSGFSDGVVKSKDLIGHQCKENLLTLGYYVDKDYSLNDYLFQVCNKDSQKYCGLAKLQQEQDQQQKKSLLPHAVVHCLVRKWNDHFHKESLDLLSEDCSLEVQRTIKLEASNLRLNYQVYAGCLEDVVRLCAAGNNKLDCLQMHFNELKARCKKTIRSFLRLDGADYSLRRLIGRSCSKMVRIFCKKSQNSVDEQQQQRRQKPHQPFDYLKCLIQHKHYTTMKASCKQALETYELMNLNDSQIDHRFIKYCSNELRVHCSDLLGAELNRDFTKDIPGVSKSKLIGCLSAQMTEALLKHKPSSFSDQCTERFTVEFVQRSDAGGIDPELQRNCHQDIARRCSTVHKRDLIKCLSKYQERLGPTCFKHLTSLSLLQSLDNQLDLELSRECSNSIEVFCSHAPSPHVFRCLHHSLRKEGFDNKCKKLVFRRLKDRIINIRLNPHLIQTCSEELVNQCHLEENAVNSNELSTRDRDVALSCLKSAFREHRKFLRAQCRILILEIVMDANLDYHLDPDLEQHCNEDVKQNCKHVLVDSSKLSEGEVQECLKKSLLDGSVKSSACKEEIIKLLHENKADIHTDPQLYSVCKRELNDICQSEYFGEGRKLSCLLWAMENKATVSHLSQPCLDLLLSRRSMWELASKMEAPNSVREIVYQVAESDSRYYVLAIIAIMLLCMLMIGVYCGQKFNLLRKDGGRGGISRRIRIGKTVGFWNR